MRGGVPIAAIAMAHIPVVRVRWMLNRGIQMARAGEVVVISVGGGVAVISMERIIEVIGMPGVGVVIERVIAMRVGVIAIIGVGVAMTVEMRRRVTWSVWACPIAGRRCAAACRCAARRCVVGVSVCGTSVWAPSAWSSCGASVCGACPYAGRRCAAACPYAGRRRGHRGRCVALRNEMGVGVNGDPSRWGASAWASLWGGGSARRRSGLMAVTVGTTEPARSSGRRVKSFCLSDVSDGSAFTGNFIVSRVRHVLPPNSFRPRKVKFH